MRGSLSRSGGMLALIMLAVFALPAAAPAQHAPTNIGVLAKLPSPGSPQGVTVGPDGLVYAASLNQDDPSIPDVIWAYDLDGKQVLAYTIKGQDLTRKHGISKLVFDGDGHLYAMDQQGPTVLRLDVAGLRTGDAHQQAYATVPDLKPCDGTNAPECSPVAEGGESEDFEAVPDYPVFARDGTMYISDSLQGVIWRVPPGGGTAKVFYSDIRLQPGMGAPAYGPSGNRMLPDGHTLMFTTCVQRPGDTENLISGYLLKLPILPDGNAGKLEVFWESEPGDCPGDVEVARSGRVYTSLVFPQQAVAGIGPDGQELWRAPGPVENALLPVPFNTPLGVAIDGRGRLLVGNNSFFTHDPSSWAILTMDIGEQSVPPIYPHLGRHEEHGHPGRARSTPARKAAPPRAHRGRQCPASRRRSRGAPRRSSALRAAPRRSAGSCARMQRVPPHAARPR